MPTFIFIGGKNPGSQTITSGSGTFIVPYYADRLRVRAWGAGSGGQGKSGTANSDTGRTAGGNTTFSGISAGGATIFTGGTASGGDSNINGNPPGTLGIGGAAPRTDIGGGAQGSIPAGNATQNGNPGNSYGGGASSAVYWDGANRWVGSGGSSGAFVEKVYLPADLSPGSSVSYAVGAGGLGGDGTSSDGGKGADGVLVIEWDY